MLTNGRQSVRLHPTNQCVAELSVFDSAKGRLSKTLGIRNVHTRDINFLKADRDLRSEQFALDSTDHLNQCVTVAFDAFDCEAGAPQSFSIRLDRLSVADTGDPR